ncbi:MAG TPA: acetylglutamate kinase, partial [Mariniphaga anaerophila]|nr:acetylglutamate kinase [Mariniphaga anaerophila]
MDRLTIIKVGGKVVEDSESLNALLDQFIKFSGNKILVHGGGRTATEIAAKLGIETEMVDGRRITGKSMLDVVTMVYGGLVNKKIVAGLQARGCNAIGLTGADLNLISARKRPVQEIDYGFVGDIV